MRWLSVITLLAMGAGELITSLYVKVEYHKSWKLSRAQNFKVVSH